MAAKFIFRKADAERVVAWECKISVPVGPGEVQEQSVVARFKLLSSEETADTLKPMDLMGKSGDVLLLKKVLVGFADLKDETGQSVDDPSAIELMLSLPYAVAGLSRGYFEMSQGRLTKN